MNKGILFDVDGTLWDSAAQVAESWNEVLARYPHLGVRITARDMYDNMGKTMMDIGKTLFPGLSQEECRKVMEECMTYENHYLLVSVQTFVHDLGKNFMPEMTEKHEILMSRVMSVVLAMGALIIALYIKNAYNVLMFAWSFYAAAAGLPSLAALYWKKATSQGIISAMTGGFVVCVGWKLAGNPWGLGETVPGALVCGILLVAVSLATCKKHPCRMA